MDKLIILYATFVVMIAALTWIALRSAEGLPARLGAMILAVALMAASYVGLLELLGRPKPVELAWALNLSLEPEVLATELREGEAIYLWLREEASPEPMSYRLPWSLEQAKRLQQARQQAEANGTDMRMRQQSGENSDTEQEIHFYASHQAALPAKN